MLHRRSAAAKGVTRKRSTKAARNARPPQSLEDRIQGCYAALPRSERAVADLILEFPGRVATHSATELAELAGASKAAVTRFFRSLGYVSYARARADAREAQQWGSPVYLDGANGSPATAPRTPLQSHLAGEVELLTRTLESQSEADLEAIAAAIAQARRVLVVGFRNSHFLAGYACAQFGLVRGSVELVPQGGETLAERLVGLGNGDVVVAIGFRRRVPQFERAVAAASATGARILLVSDPGGGTHAPWATWVLRCHCRGSSLFDSYIGALSVLNFLAARVAAKAGAAGRRRLKWIEQLHVALRELA